MRSPLLFPCNWSPVLDSSTNPVIPPHSMALSLSSSYLLSLSLGRMVVLWKGGSIIRLSPRRGRQDLLWALRPLFSSTACNEWKDWPGCAAACAHIDPVLLHTIVHHLTTVVLEQPRGPSLTSPPSHSVLLSQKSTMSLHLNHSHERPLQPNGWPNKPLQTSQQSFPVQVWLNKGQMHWMDIFWLEMDHFVFGWTWVIGHSFVSKDLSCIWQSEALSVLYSEPLMASAIECFILAHNEDFINIKYPLLINRHWRQILKWPYSLFNESVLSKCCTLCLSRSFMRVFLSK